MSVYHPDVAADIAKKIETMRQKYAAHDGLPYLADQLEKYIKEIEARWALRGVRFTQGQQRDLARWKELVRSVRAELKKGSKS